MTTTTVVAVADLEAELDRVTMAAREAAGVAEDAREAVAAMLSMARDDIVDVTSQELRTAKDELELAEQKAAGAVARIAPVQARLVEAEQAALVAKWAGVIRDSTLLAEINALKAEKRERDAKLAKLMAQGAALCREGGAELLAAGLPWHAGGTDQTGWRGRPGDPLGWGVEGVGELVAWEFGG